MSAGGAGFASADSVVNGCCGLRLRGCEREQGRARTLAERMRKRHQDGASLEERPLPDSNWQFEPLSGDSQKTSVAYEWAHNILQSGPNRKGPALNGKPIWFSLPW